MIRTRIVFASMLKPVDDVRTYHKLAKSLVPAHKYEIFIIGYPSKEPFIDPDIKFLSLRSFSRWSLDRARDRLRVEQMIRELSPDILLINTHELLPAAARIKKQLDLKLIYDIRENYYDNLVHAGFPFSKRMAKLVRKKENRIAPYIDHFILAETCYQDLPFIDSRYSILQNKALKPSSLSKTREKPNSLVFTGTLSEQSGVFRAIEIAEELRNASPDLRLKIAGNSFDIKLRKQLHHLISQRSWIDTEISEAPIPYDRILEAIQSANAGMILYSPLQGIRDKMPTKLYEYVAHGLPVICLKDSPWLDFMNSYPAAVEWNNNPDKLLDQFRKTKFYTNRPGDEVQWVKEALVFRELVENLLT